MIPSFCLQALAPVSVEAHMVTSNKSAAQLDTSHLAAVQVPNVLEQQQSSSFAVRASAGSSTQQTDLIIGIVDFLKLPFGSSFHLGELALQLPLLFAGTEAPSAAGKSQWMQERCSILSLVSAPPAQSLQLDGSWSTMIARRLLQTATYPV